ncbi:hypothetical protein L1987_28814 [Smallanthus sonchifolius]|uniref:Uncharacterized protein n=1 Tax=Smallanthus sonchifolius TaxID=185202 RepID=A0ACB9I029_9ASTR|nr:hypothetical protein L1987_28814 [Smallanthus sonchifolius]
MIDGGGSHTKNKDDEQMKKDEYLKREDVIQLSTICAEKKIKFHIDVQAGSSPKKVAAKAAISLSVTWVVLDRQMKKDRKYFMEKLTCGILRMKHDNTIEKLREPIIIDDKKQKLVKRTINSNHVSYGEMIPVMSKQELSSKISTSSFTTSEVSTSTDTENLSAVYFHQDENDSKNIQSTNLTPESKDQIEVEPFDEQDKFEYSVCSVCEYKRPSIRLKQDFTYTELQEVTNGFSSDKYLSEGGFGFVYEGKLKCGLKVAVKQHKDVSSQGEKEFKSEVNVLSKARHPNLVMLLGSCSEGAHRLLVYEFVCNGQALTWDKRIKIELGAARGLEYLHSINIIHRDMRPNNILLGDFGLARTVCVDTDETGVVGTLGYVAPEYAECGKVIPYIPGSVIYLQARPLLEKKNYPDLIDEKILDSHDVQVFQLYLIVKLAKGCLKKDPIKRKTMKYLVALSIRPDESACDSYPACNSKHQDV